LNPQRDVTTREKFYARNGFLVKNYFSLILKSFDDTRIDFALGSKFRFALGTRPAHQLASGHDTLPHHRDEPPRSADERIRFDALFNDLKFLFHPKTPCFIHCLKSLWFKQV
jgi:hypothetical protein